jgi:hypothetical protein
VKTAAILRRVYLSFIHNRQIAVNGYYETRQRRPPAGTAATGEKRHDFGARAKDKRAPAG